MRTEKPKGNMNQEGVIDLLSTIPDRQLSEFCVAAELKEPDEIVDVWGAETLFWLASTSPPGSRNRAKLFAGVNELTSFRIRDGYRIVKFLKSESVRRGCDMAKPIELFRQYALVDYLRNNLEVFEFLGQVLANTFKQDDPDKYKSFLNRINRYGLECITPRYDDEFGGYGFGWGEDGVRGRLFDDVIYDPYIDTPAGFILTYMRRPQAIAGLVVHGESLQIRQIQGVRAFGVTEDGRKDISKRINGAWGLEPIDWQRALIEISAKIAYDLQLPLLSIQSGGKNQWALGHVPHITKTEAEQKYDKQARRLGFIKGPDLDWYVSAQAKLGKNRC